MNNNTLSYQGGNTVSMNMESSLSCRLIVGLFSLMSVVAIIGCGKKTESTLPPVNEEVKSQDAAQQPGAAADAAGEATATAEEQTSSGWVIKDLINVRSKPSTTSDVVAQLPRGTEVKLIELTDKWWKVQLADGRTAHVFETLLTTERYVDPWTRFKFDASRVDPALKIISGVAGIDGEAPSAALTVSVDEWNSLSADDQRKTATSAFNYWSDCLKKCGYDPKSAVIVFRDAGEKELGRVKLEAGKAAFTAKQ